MGRASTDPLPEIHAVGSTARALTSMGPGGAVAREDRVAREEPLEVRAQGPGQEPVRIAVTMRTPGDDLELAIGFLHGEGLLGEARELAAPPVRELPLEGAPANAITVRVQTPFDAARLQRNFYATSSCGICGKAAIEHIHVSSPPIARGPLFTRSQILAMPAALRSVQRTFEATGGLHATGAFEIGNPTPIVVREDVGRHNAMDKVIGRLLLDGRLPWSRGALVVSGRASFELVQKAAMAGVPLLCAISAPSSLAVDTAARVGMTLIGFLRGDAFNVYSGVERVDVDA